MKFRKYVEPARKRAMLIKVMFTGLTMLVCLNMARADAFDDARTAHRANDYKKAIQLYKRAADEGIPEAMYNIAFMYFNGKGVQKNNTTGIKWLNRAANINYPLAQFSLGMVYENGQYGEKVNYQKAYQFYKQAADNRYLDAIFRLGLVYMSGELGINKDDKNAAYYLEWAGNGGIPEAQFYTAENYRYGYGVKKNKVTAYKWYYLAAERLPAAVINEDLGIFGAIAAAGQVNSQNARIDMSSLKSKMTSQQILQAEQEAQAWLAKNKQ